MGDGDYKTVDYIWPFYKRVKCLLTAINTPP